MVIPVLPAVFLAGTAARVFTALAARASTDAAIRLTGAALTSASLAESLRIKREQAYKAPKYNAAGNLSGSGFGKEPNSDTGKSENKQVKRIKSLKKSRSALGFGKRSQPKGPASVKDIVRAGKTSLRRGNRSLAAFIAARYSDKAITKYQDYAGRLRRSIRLRKQVVEIDANTFRVRKHIVKTDTAGNNPYSCTCPDFSQFSDDDRNWLGSKAGPFNPCKHMMAVRDRNKTPSGGGWSCSSGVCTFNALGGTYATKALCEASRFKIDGGQCVGAKYNGNVTYTLKQGAFESPGNNVIYSCGSSNIYGPVNGVIYEVSVGFISLYIDCFDNLGVAQRVSVYTIVNTNPVPMIELIPTEAIFRRCDGLPECGDGYQCST